MNIISNSPLRSVPSDYCPPGADCWFDIPEGVDAGKTLFYYDHCTGDTPPSATVLFVHGNPECSYTYRHVCEALRASNASIRIIALDHIGFGLSDQASFEMVDMHHAANLKMLIRHLDLQQVTLVVHDWGGPIGTGAFVDEMDRVKNLVVLNTTIFPMPKDDITYTNWPVSWLPWSSFGKLIPDALWGGTGASVMQGANKGSRFKLYLGTVVMQLRYVLRLIPKHSPAWVFSESFRTKANAKSSKRNVLQTPYWGYGYRYDDPTLGEQDNRAFYKKLQQQVPQHWGAAGRNIACAGHFGDYDPCGKKSVVEQWVETLPRLRQELHVYPGLGHFIEEYVGPEIAASILKLNSITE